jgi:hypothetical protein
MRKPLVLDLTQALFVAMLMTSAPLPARADGECQLKPGIPDKVKCIEDKIDSFVKRVDIATLNQTIKTIQVELGKTLKSDDKVKLINHDGALNKDNCLFSEWGASAVGPETCGKADLKELWQLHK